MSNNFTLRDSGERREFGTGSKRDASGTSKSRPDLISPYALWRVGEHLRKGAEKYGFRNWELGQPTSEMFASLFRHVVLFAQGDILEDHLSAIIFGAQGIIHFQERAKLGDPVARRMLDDPASLAWIAQFEKLWKQEFFPELTDPEEPPEQVEQEPLDDADLWEFGFHFGPSINGDHEEPRDWLSN